MPEWYELETVPLSPLDGESRSSAVLIGTASLAYGQGSTSFGLGAAAGSMLWFLSLGVAAFWLGRRLNSLHVWRALDGAVALMMWGTAAWLGFSLV